MPSSKNSDEPDIFISNSEQTDEIVDYVNSSLYYRRTSYIPDLDRRRNNTSNGNNINAGETYNLDPFTGNLIDGTEDLQVPPHILRDNNGRESGQSASAENEETAHNIVPKKKGSFEKLRSSLRRSSKHSFGGPVSTTFDMKAKAEKFIGSLHDPKSRITLAWKDITYSVSAPTKNNKKARKQILFGLDGQARPGELVAIIGSSGAGKTTLLNILAGKVFEGKIEGEVVANGRRRSLQWRNIIGYVEQEDLLYKTLTVRETLSYAALLRLPRYLSRKQKLERVDEIIQQLGLEKCQHTFIGGEGLRGVSGGERKRVSIGVELVTNPRMLFMDEPTTGLDAFTSYSLMENISQFVNKEAKTVILTIHQPREDIFFLFDKILLMSQGKMIFYGPTQCALDHFESLGLPCPLHENPANFFIDMISVDFKEKDKKKIAREKEVLAEIRKTAGDNSSASESRSVKEGDTSSVLSITRSQQRVSMLQSAWLRKKCSELIRRGAVGDNNGKLLSAANIPHPATSLIAHDPGGNDNFQIVDHSSNNFWITELHILLGRYFLDQWRDKVLFFATLGQTFFIFLVVGFTFFQLGYDQSDIQARLGVLFLIAVNGMILVLQPILLSFPLEKALIKKERWSSSYRNSTVYIAKAISVIPLRIVLTTFFALSVYYIIGLNPSVRSYFILYLTLLLLNLNSQALGLWVSAMVPDVMTAQIVAPMVFLFFLIYGGNLVGVTVPAVLAWIKYISTIRYAYMALFQNEFTGETFTCTNGLAPVDGQCPVGGGFATGEQVIAFYDMGQFPIYTCLLILGGMSFGFHFLAMVALYITTKPRSKVL